MIDLLRAQLLALKAQAEAMLATLDVCETPPSSGEQSPVCLHPETESIGTFGAPEYRCTICKASVPPPA